MNIQISEHQSRLAPNNVSPTYAMAEFEQILLSNSGEDAFESAIKLLSAKLIDELDQPTGSEKQFKVHSTPELTHQAIQELFAKAVQRWPHLDTGTVELGITAPHLVRSIRPLLGWSFHKSNLSWLDATLERLVARDSKGALGQYFTPREIIRLCVDVLNPKPSELVIDPACGSGGFLFEASEHSLTNFGEKPRCLGIDFSGKSVKVATLLAAAAADQKITISKANSLDGRAYQTETPSEWGDFLCQQKASETRRASTWGAWNRLGCDVLLTNPPFAGAIDEFDLLDAYEAQQDKATKKSVSREHLFLERAVDLLRPGGRLAIVIPQGILANTTASHLRSWLLRKCRILAVVGLHQHAFTPYTGVKTAILFLEKPEVDNQPPSDYPVLFAVSRESGKDSSGRTVCRADYPSIATALSQFLVNQGHDWAQIFNTVEENVCAAEEVPLSEILKSGRLDAEHYDPASRALERKLSELSSEQIGDTVDQRVTRFKKQNFQEITYIDISSVDNRTGLATPGTIEADEAPSRASYIVEQGDVLVSTVRPERNVVAMITENFDAPAVASNGFCVLRAKTIPPELLFAYCKTNAFKRMLTMHSTASMYPTVADRDVLGVPFVRPPKETEQNVVELIKSGLHMIEEAQKQIHAAIQIMDNFVEEAHAK